MAVAPPNPIEQRLKKLEELWESFLQLPNARILRWVLDDDSRQVVQAFVDIQCEPVSEIPDLFVEFTCPFRAQDSFSSDILASLSEQLEASRSEIEASGIRSSWRPPVMSENTPGAVFLQSLVEFHQPFHEIARVLVVVLSPESKLDPRGWRTWLQQLSKENIPATIRFMLADSKEHPVLADLAVDGTAAIVSIDPELDMAAAYQEIVANVPGDGPGHDFRQYFVALTNAAGKGDTVTAKDLAEKAVAVAAAQKWHYLVGTVQMALGAACFTAGDIQGAICAYRAANAAVSGIDDIASKKLDVPTRMAEAAALVAAKQFREAAVVYEKAAAVAEQQAEPASELECWRMAGWCHETAGQRDQSWDCGEKSLAAGQKLEISDRRMSTLAYAGQMLLRLTEKGLHRRRKDEIESQMEELLGADWKSSLASGVT